MVEVVRTTLIICKVNRPDYSNRSRIVNYDFDDYSTLFKNV